MGGFVLCVIFFFFSGSVLAFPFSLKALALPKALVFRS